MKIWLDDQGDDIERPYRLPPQEYILVTNWRELKSLLNSSSETIEAMDFRHDLLVYYTNVREYLLNRS